MADCRTARIGDVCTIEKGITGLAKAIPGSYPLVATGAERKTSTNYQFDCNAVCIPLVSSTGHGKKSLNYVHYQEGKFALGSILAAVIPKDENVLNARYLHVYLQKNKDRVLVPLMRGAANVSLSMTAIANIEVPLPSLAEQKKILDKIDSISSEHADFQKESDIQIDLFKKLRQQILQEAIEGKLTAEWRKEHPELISGENHATKLLEKIKAEKERLIKESRIKKEIHLPPVDKNEHLSEIPAEWTWSRFGTSLDVRDGTHDTPAYVNAGIPLVTSKNLCNGKIDFTNVKFTSEKDHQKINIRSGVNAGDILFAMIGTIGNPVVVTDKNTNFSIKNVALFKVFDRNRLCIAFLYWYLVHVQKEMENSAKGALQPFVSLSYLRKHPFVIPPIAEQHVIVERIDKIMVKIDDLEKQVTERKVQSEMLMQSVLREAFSNN